MTPNSWMVVYSKTAKSMKLCNKLTSSEQQSFLRNSVICGQYYHSKYIILISHPLNIFKSNQYFLYNCRNAIPWDCREVWGSGAVTSNNETGHGSSVCCSSGYNLNSKLSQQEVVYWVPLVSWLCIHRFSMKTHCMNTWEKPHETISIKVRW